MRDNLKNHICEECAYAASQKGALKQHIETVHEKYRNHFCEECVYAASQRSNLNEHMVSHHKFGDMEMSWCCNRTEQKLSLQGQLILRKNIFINVLHNQSYFIRLKLQQILVFEEYLNIHCYPLALLTFIPSHVSS